jgi:hypothetical protein
VRRHGKRDPPWRAPVLSIQTNKNKNCKSAGKITACKVFCKEYCFHISVGKITACKVYCSRLRSIVQCALPQLLHKYSQILHMVTHVGKLRGTSYENVSVFIDCLRFHPQKNLGTPPYPRIMVYLGGQILKSGPRVLKFCMGS